jgi:DNA-binding PadR family transcriptional regulator
MYDKELLKGILPIIILKLLSGNEKMYGYRITQTVKDLSGDKILLKEGSLYPALHKLRDAGFVETETENIGKRVRHYYLLTEKGKAERKERESELRDFLQTVQKIMA